MMSAEPVVTAVVRSQGLTQALKDGSARAPGFRIAFEEVPVLVQAFRRMVRDLEFDVCEMSLMTYLCAKAAGVPFTALPVFISRGFHHGAILYNTCSGIQGPTDLAGRRVAVNRGYTVTTSVWTRGILADEHGVDLDSVTWVPTGEDHVASYTPPPNVQPAPPGSTVQELLTSGQVDAAVGLELFEHPDIATLVEAPHQAAISALATTGYFPINHLVVIKDETLAAHPDLATALFEAFVASKQAYLDGLDHAVLRTGWSANDRVNAEVQEVTGRDPLPFGITSNRPMLEVMLRYGVAQHILPADLELADLFVPSTLSSEG